MILLVGQCADDNKGIVYTAMMEWGWDVSIASAPRQGLTNEAVVYSWRVSHNRLISSVSCTAAVLYALDRSVVASHKSS